MEHGHGGARPGAGRKTKAEKFAGPVAAAEQIIVDQLPAIVHAQIDLALGATVQEVDRETGGLIVYTRPPDARAGQYLIDRILGKPTQRTELTGADGGPLAVTMSDDERAARAADLFDTARARRDGLAADGQPGGVS